MQGPGALSRAAKRQKNSLLARYSETLGEMMLRRQTEMAIRAGRQEAELNARSKSAFLGAMSHELRTPLNAIIGFSDMMREPGAVSAADNAEYAGHIAKAGRRLLDVVSDVLDMSKLESGSLALTKAPVAIADVAAAAAEQVKPDFDAKKQLLDVRLDRSLREVEIDHKRVRQILVNLLSNASKFTASGGRVLLMARPIADGGVTIAIADTGIGMTHEAIMLALKPFMQVDTSRARTQEGVGLGLPLALGLARLHGGTLHIDRPTSNIAAPASVGATPNFRERRGMPAAPPIRLAHIVSVSGSHAVALLERQDAITGADSRVQIGGLVKVMTPVSAVMGIVAAISAPMTASEGEVPAGLIEINLMGEVAMDPGKRLTFRRGVSALPSLGDGVLLADKHDLTRVYAPPQAASIKIGSLFQDASVPARLLIDDLLSKHFLVVGSTGSGKSSALTCVLQRLLAEHNHAHVVILDVHNEYAASFGGLVEPISLDNFHLPFWMLDFPEMTAALVSRDAHHDAEVEILAEGVVFAKKRYSDSATSRSGALVARKSADSHVITVDTPTPFRMSDVIAFIDEQLGRLERSQLMLPYRRLRTRIETLVSDQRYNFMFGSLSVQDTMGDVLARLFRVPAEGRPISVIDLSTVPPEILDVVISVISRLAFDLAVWSKGGLPMLLVCEEAHRYAPADSQKFVPTRHALSRIAKEGRKYGLSLALVTQRPSELDATIVSQCGTAIVLRLSSERDQEVIRGSTYEGMADLIEFLPLLGDREALVLGQGVSMPMRVRFDDIGKRVVPRSGHASFSKGWKTPNMDREGLDAIVARWRNNGRDRT